MAITYPLSTPTSIGIASVTLSANNAVAVSQSPFTFKQQIVAHQGQQWSASVSIPSVRKDLAEPWVSFLMSLKGQAGTFLLGDPNRKAPQGVITGAITVDGAQSAGSDTLDITGLALSTSSVLVAGDYIQLGSAGSARLYKVLQTVDSDASGNATLDIWPDLRADVIDTAPVTYTNTVGVFRLASAGQSWDINDRSNYGISFDAVEAIT